MDTSSILGIKELGSATSMPSLRTLSGDKVSEAANSVLKSVAGGEDRTAPFDALLQSAMDMIEETNQYSNEAAEAELAYAMGLTNSTHDLQVAQMKANIALQYTVAVRNAVIEAYKEIMQLQF